MTHQKNQNAGLVPDYGEVILYQSEDGSSDIDVHLKDGTVWLTLNQIADLFGRDKSVISRHLRNIFREGEVPRETTVAKKATVQNEGGHNVTRLIEWYNLDPILSVGYRVNSKRGTQFRIWATRVLKDHLVRGYSLNQRRLAEQGSDEIKRVLELLALTLEQHNLVSDEGRAVLEIVTRYARTWQLLLQYDEDRLPLPASCIGGNVGLEIKGVRAAITTLKQELSGRGEATDLFGNERSHGLVGIIGALHQTFGGQDLYPSVEEKAAHLLYFVIKDHPFTDGNKRIGSFLFLYFLKINGLLVNHHFDTKTLVALALLTAASEPANKDLLIRLIVNLISE